MLPGVAPGAVVQRIADLVMGDGFAVILGQQILPAGVAVIVNNGIQGSADFSGGIGILSPAGDVARNTIGPDPGLACLLVVLPQQLVGRIIFVSRGIGAVIYGNDVAVLIVAVGIANIVGSSLKLDPTFL